MASLTRKDAILGATRPVHCTPFVFFQSQDIAQRVQPCSTTSNNKGVSRIHSRPDYFQHAIQTCHIKKPLAPCSNFFSFAWLSLLVHTLARMVNSKTRIETSTSEKTRA